MTDPQSCMLRITGYSDRFSARPGDSVRFHINAEHGESFQAEIVRLVHGDTNPQGPGYKEELINSPLRGTHQGKHQPLHAGSYIMVPHSKHFDLRSFTLCAYIFPTTPVTDTEGVAVGTQGVLTKWNAAEKTGYGLFINEAGELCLKLGAGNGRVEEIATGGSGARVAVIMSTFSYMAYANDNLSVNSVVAQLLTGQVPLLQPGDLLLNKERGYGLGTYTSYRDYQVQGGRWCYLAANGFYWISVPHPDNPNIMEVRKGDNGTRAWTIQPGEYCNAFDGKHGGLWRVRGRVMSKLLGVVFTSFGLTYSSYYRRSPDSELPECAWIMKGVGKDEPIGDFGLVGDGAAGLELDRYDLELGTPHRAYLLAHSEGHNDIFVSVSEESTFHARGSFLAGTGESNPKTRADIVYYKTPNDGAVFSVGSMSWIGSLSHSGYDNNVSRIMQNVIDGFVKDGPLP